MAFQGDVAGIGLGELLQGLARGGQDGSLRLHSGSLSASVGMSSGQIRLLAEPGEDPEVWRRRCEQAWLNSGERVDSLYMSEIAYAARLETMYRLLDAQGVHFRFDPGPIDGDSSAVRSPALSVEFLLLEYARLSDDRERHGDWALIDDEDVPRLLDGGTPPSGSEKFWEQCDGTSTLQEIADRLAWPLRQAKATLQELLVEGRARLAHPRELLALAEVELQNQRFQRAAARLTAWVNRSPGGPGDVGDIELILTHWETGHFRYVLPLLPDRTARRLLRRIDAVWAEPTTSVARWKELRQTHRLDGIAEVRLIHRQLADDSDPHVPSAVELLRVARHAQDAGCRMRAGVFLRAAASRLPESTSVRLELGTRMFEVGLASEGSPWIVEACRTLIHNGHADKALGPLRNVLAHYPGNREARSLMAVARGRTPKGRRRRRSFVAVLCMILLVSMVAMVREFGERSVRRGLAEIESRADDPGGALEMLDTMFPSSEDQRVLETRETLVSRLYAHEQALAKKWYEHFEALQAECSTGDPLVGFRGAIALPDPPKLDLVQEEWPYGVDLLLTLAGRFDEKLRSMPPPALEQLEVQHEEERMVSTFAALRELMAANASAPGVESFALRLTEIEAALELRFDERAALREEHLRKQMLQRQDLLLATAREHSAAGDHERALSSYQQLLSLDASGLLKKVLAPEIEELEKHLAAFAAARSLASSGEHAKALETLSKVCPDPREHILPWKVSTEPAGGRARMHDGTTRVAPFIMESAFGVPVSMVFEMEGHESVRLTVENPADHVVVLSRIPSLHWPTSARVEAPPVPVGDDHILCDRKGHIVRIGDDNSVRWESQLNSLGGVARAPIFLPRKPDSLLLLTEDGDAWIVDANTGNVDGPWSCGSPPIEGPLAVDQGVVARFRNGAHAVWTERLRPDTLIEDESASPSALGAQARSAGTQHGSTVGMAIVRSGIDSNDIFPSPWTDWGVQITPRAYRVANSKSDSSFVVRPSGDWLYVAWEAPRAALPTGRLWVSDAEGLRAFVP
jgi:tetratricopeptide (TPR) repeat protein